MRFPSSVRRDPAIERWMRGHRGKLGAIAQRWFEIMRGCGDDVRELLHDGHPTACVGDAAFAYVNAFTAHVNVGFFRGAEIADPHRLLEGTGKFMRHVKIRPERDVDATALSKLIEAAYTDMKERTAAGLKRVGDVEIRARHRATCHCGKVELELHLPNGIVDARRCDCSLCRRKGAVVASVSLVALRIVQGAEHLKLYQFNTHTAKHYFCSNCGIYTHHQRRSTPDQYGFNVGCLEGVNPFDIERIPIYDGVNHPADVQHGPDPNIGDK